MADVKAISAGRSEELFRFSVETLTWTKLDTEAGVTGTGPSARYGHSMASVGTDIYVFGGDTDGGERMMEVGWGGGGGRWWGWVCGGILWSGIVQRCRESFGLTALRADGMRRATPTLSWDHT